MQERSKNFLILGLIVGVFVAFFLAGRFLINPDELPRLNKGTLIVPHVSIDTLDLRDENGAPYTSADTAGQWSLTYIANGTCDDACKNGLFYLIRQLRLSLDRERKSTRLNPSHVKSTDADS